MFKNVQKLLMLIFVQSKTNLNYNIKLVNN